MRRRWRRRSPNICAAPGTVSCLDQLLAYFLLLLSELEVVFELDGDGLMSSVSQVVCLLFPYRALGAELDRGMVPS